MATLLQLLPAEIESRHKTDCPQWRIPCLHVEDAPRFRYREVMLDVTRHFISVEHLKKQIDIMADLKFNHLHLHLSDNQGWRIEIKRYPLLTEKGAYRTDIDGSRYGGFYTQEQIRDIVAYAAQRFITIVPEIDIPAHSQALNVCYPELSCTGENAPVRNIWGPDHLVLCPGKDNMFEFLDHVFAEMAALFPGTYFHIGGDECPKNNWEKCRNCQQRIVSEHLHDDNTFTAEEKLQSYTTRRIEKLLARYGKKIIGWEEILQGGIGRTATIMSWRGEEGGIAAAQAGNEVIMCPHTKGLYFDYYQGSSKVEPPTIGGYSPLSKVYKYEPIPHQLAGKDNERFIIGIQANLWSEYLYEEKDWERALYPRMMAVAEIGWCRAEERNLDAFLRRLDNMTMRLHLKGYNFHIPLPEMVNGPLQTVAFTDSAKVAFTTTLPLKMVYTTDGKNPTPSSRASTDPLTFHEDKTLKIASVLPNGIMSRVMTYKIERQEYAPSVEVDSTLQDGLVESRSDTHNRRTINLLTEITDAAQHPKYKREVDDFVKTAVGYIDIPRKGIYCFSTQYDELYIDNRLIVDNNGEVKQGSRNDSSVALDKGLHALKIVFRSEAIGGWPAFWGRGNIGYKLLADEDYRPITPQMLYHLPQRQ